MSARVLADFWVPGVPKPKGSMTHIGGGAMKQSVKGSAQWATMVDYAARRDFVARCRPLPPVPYEGAVTVTCAFFMPYPTAMSEIEAAQTSAVHERIGDDDKLVRNVLDALKSAGVYRDDVLVDDARGLRVYAIGEWRPGAHVRVTVPALCAANRRRNAELAAREAMMRTVQGV